MKIVAILQNQWFKDPQRAKHQLETTFKGDREKFIRIWLFYRCLTGRRLRIELGEDLCDEIVWEECSKLVGAFGASKFPADIEHLRMVIQKHQPKLIIAFGKLAQDGVTSAVIRDTGNLKQHGDRMLGEPENCKIIFSPHPAARGTEKLAEFRRAMAEVKNCVAKDKFFDASLGIPWGETVQT